MDLKDKIEKLYEKLTNENVIDIMKTLGVKQNQFIETEDYIIFPTICHNLEANEGSMKLYFYKNTKLFCCYTECNETFSIFDLVEKRYKLYGQKYSWYYDIFSFIENFVEDTSLVWEVTSKPYSKQRDRYKQKQRDVKLQVYPEGILEVFNKIYPIEWLNDSITKESMDKFNILYSITQNKIVIPHYSINNELIGIRGRALNVEEANKYGKYMPIKIEDKFYSHPLSLNLYGLNITKNAIKRNRICYIFEAEKSVLQMNGYYGDDNCSVASCGNKFNKIQLELLLKNCQPKEIVICYDKENSDDGKYFNKLNELCKKYKNYCNFSFIYDREELLEQKNSPSDRGKDIFEKLIIKRIGVS